MRRAMSAVWIGLTGAMLLCAVGCAGHGDGPTTRPTGAPARDEALRDPFNYRPAGDFPDISGGGLTDLDMDALRRDLNNVFNP